MHNYHKIPSFLPYSPGQNIRSSSQADVATSHWGQTGHHAGGGKAWSVCEYHFRVY